MYYEFYVYKESDIQSNVNSPAVACFKNGRGAHGLAKRICKTESCYVYKVRPRVFSLYRKTGILDVVYYPKENNYIHNYTSTNSYSDEDNTRNINTPYGLYILIASLLIVICILVCKFIF